MAAPKKSLGQHWLFDSQSLGAICDAANITAKDTILEIGPGLGTLTIELTARAKEVVAVELDAMLARKLPARVPAANLRVINSDILQFNRHKLPSNYKVVANVPYYITSKIVRFLLETPPRPSVIVMLVQKEVAERLAAEAGNMSILAVSAQFYAKVTLGQIIKAQAFTPAPKVDSRVVILTPHKQNLFTDIDEQQFFRLIKAGFSEKRKTLRNALSGGLALQKTDVENLLQAVNIPASARAEALSIEQWYDLTKAYFKKFK